MTTERKRGGKGSPRTEIVSIRFDPKTRYALELAARIQRRSVANFIEWAVDESLRNVSTFVQNYDRETSISFALDELWDIDEAERFLKLSQNCPSLLTHEDQLILKLLLNCNDCAPGLDGSINISAWRECYPVAKHLSTLSFDYQTLEYAINGGEEAVKKTALEKWLNENNIMLSWKMPF